MAPLLGEVIDCRMIGLAPSATLEAEAGIRSETLQRFLARNAGVAEGRLTPRGEREMRASFRRTVLVVDEGSLASTVQARDLLRIADRLRIPRVVLVGDEKQLDAVDAGKPFAQLQRAGMKTMMMDEILRQKDPALKQAVRASLAGDIRGAFERLGDRVAEVEPDNLAGAAAERAKDAERDRQAAALEAARSRGGEIGRDKPAREPAGLRTPAPARSGEPWIEPGAPASRPKGTQSPRPARTPEPEREQPPAPARRLVPAPKPVKAPEPVKERALVMPTQISNRALRQRQSAGVDSGVRWAIPSSRYSRVGTCFRHLQA